MHDVYALGTRLGQQRRRLERALAASHDQDSGPGESLEARKLARVGGALRGQGALDPRREAGERSHAGCGDDGIGAHSPAVVERRLELPAGPLHVMDAHAFD
jgi:hypothetical protein